MIYGYVRVSSREQNEARQLVAMKEAGIEDRNIIIDKQSGKDFDCRGYNQLIGTPETAPLLRAGDLLVIYSIDRLGRNYTEIRKQWQYITTEINADIQVLDMPLLDTRQQGGNLDKRFVADLVLQILSYVAERERQNIRARQAAGLEAMQNTCASVERVSNDAKHGKAAGDPKYISRKTGKAIGRPEATYPENWQDVYTAWKSDQMKAVEAMAELHLTKNTFYNLAKRYEAVSQTGSDHSH